MATTVNDTTKNSAQQANGKAIVAALRPHHVALSVPDLEETIRWYVDKLGFSVAHKFEIPDFSTHAAYLELNGFMLELFARDGSAPVREPRRDPAQDPVGEDLLVQGVKHFAFRVSDIEAAVEELKNRGVEFVWEPRVNRVDDKLTLKLSFFKDNNGNLIELIEELNQNSQEKH